MADKSPMVINDQNEAQAVLTSMLTRMPVLYTLDRGAAPRSHGGTMITVMWIDPTQSTQPHFVSKYVANLLGEKVVRGYTHVDSGYDQCSVQVYYTTTARGLIADISQAIFGDRVSVRHYDLGKAGK